MLAVTALLPAPLAHRAAPVFHVPTKQAPDQVAAEARCRAEARHRLSGLAARKLEPCGLEQPDSSADGRIRSPDEAMLLEPVRDRDINLPRASGHRRARRPVQWRG